jgi:phosphate transport system permease protein
MTETAQAAVPHPAGRGRFHSPSPLGDRLFRGLCQGAAALVVALFVVLVGVLVWEAWPAMKATGFRFLTDSTWDPEPSHRKFGALAFVWGTVATSAVAMLIAVPLGIGTAAYLSEVAPRRVRQVGSFLVEMLATVPSVVYGFWGLAVLAPAVQSAVTFFGGPNTGGLGILPAGLVLAIMVVPYVTAVSFDVCRSVPSAQREGAYALGASRWQVIWHNVLPYARPGIVGGCFLALGRALGETMAVTMLIGNRPDIKLSPFSMGNSIASVIANEFTEATYDLYLSALVELGLVLLLVSVVVNSLARVMLWRIGRVGAFRPLGERLRGVFGKKKSKADPERNGRPADPPATGPGEAARNFRRAMLVDRVMGWVLALCLAVTVGFLLLVLGYVVYRGVGGINAAFFVNMPAPVGKPGGGMANAIFGSITLVGLATLFAVPVGLLAAIYLSEYKSGRLGAVVRFVGELLSGVPSIVVGIFAYTVVVRPMGHFSGWAGAFALGLMMLPIVMRASEEALKLVPGSLRQASFALGANNWQTVMRVTLPAALPAVITAVFLSVARIAGETAPLLLTASSNQFWPSSPNDFTPSLPVYIFNYAVSPYEDWHRQAWAAALVLVVAVMTLNFGVRLLAGKRVVLAGQAA